MASKQRNHTPNTKNCKCDKCGAVANAPADKRHRKCPTAARAEHPGQLRGRWQPYVEPRL